MRGVSFAAALTGTAAVAAVLTFVPLRLLNDHKDAVATTTRAATSAQPGYAASLQKSLDAARPAGARRVVVRDCRAGRVGNEHLCTWTDGGGRCQAGFLRETPSGTMVGEHGIVPIPASRCNTATVIAWLRTQS